MQLYVTTTSPYARVARIAVIEHGLQEQVEIKLAATRQSNSPYYDLVPSGRVPVLVRDDGVQMEESDIICAYFESIGSGPPMCPAWDQDNWAYGRLHALARSFVDGVAVWGRETLRAEEDQSPTILAHEAARAQRMADLWETEIEHPLMQGKLNLAQLILCAALDSLQRYKVCDARDGRPKLTAWHARLSERASVRATHPVTGSPAG